MEIREDEKKCGIAKDKREIERVMDDLEREVGSIQHLVDKLLDTINPVIRPACPTEEACGLKEEGTATELGNAVHNYVTRLRNVNDILNDAIRRIEL